MPNESSIVITKSIRDRIRKGFIDIPYFVREFLEHDLHKEQCAVLKDMRLRPLYALSAGNRWGKGEVVAFYSTWLAAYKPVAPQFKDAEVPILNTSISQDQANIVFEKFVARISTRPKVQPFVKEIKRSPFPHVVFNTGVTWWFRNASQNGKYLEGRSYFYINFDECDLQIGYPSLVENVIEPRTWDYAGMLSHTTTPRRGKSNAYKIWAAYEASAKAGNKDPGFFYGDSRNNTFLPAQTIERFNKLPLRLLNKNVRGVFEDGQGSIQSQAIDFSATIAKGLIPAPEQGHYYVNAWDLARRSTWCVGVTLDVSATPYQLVSFERFQDTTDTDRKYWQTTIGRIRARQALWAGVTGIDRTGIGDVVMSFLTDINAIGFSLQESLRDQIVANGVTEFNMGNVGVPALEQVVGEESWFSQDELRDFDAQNPSATIWDFVCALFIALWIAKGNRSTESELPKPSVVKVTGVSKYASSSQFSVRPAFQRPPALASR